MIIAAEEYLYMHSLECGRASARLVWFSLCIEPILSDREPYPSV